MSEAMNEALARVQRARFIQDHHFLISPWCYSARERSIAYGRMLALQYAKHRAEQIASDGHPQGE